MTLETVHLNRMVTFGFLLMLYSSPAPAQDNASRSSDIASMVNGMTAALVRIDTSTVPFPDFSEAFKGQTLHVAVDLPFSTTQPAVRIYCREEVPRGIDLLRSLFNVGIGEPVRADGSVHYEISLGPKLDSDNRIDPDLLPHVSSDLATSLGAVSGAPLAVAISLPDYFKQLYSDLVPRLPESLGGGETAVLLRDVRWTAVAVDLRSASMMAEVKAVSDEAAERFAQQAPRAFAALVTYLPPSDFLQALLQAGQLSTEEDRVRIDVQADLQSADLLRMAAEWITQLRNRRREMTTLKQVGLAMHNYHDMYRSFPPDTKGRDEQGRPRLSWRVHILPFIGEKKLYREFRLGNRSRGGAMNLKIGLDADWHFWPQCSHEQDSAGTRSPNDARCQSVRPGFD